MPIEKENKKSMVMDTSDRGYLFVGQFDIYTDGERFLMLIQPAMAYNRSTKEIGPKINIILNWFEKLKERVAVS